MSGGLSVDPAVGLPSGHPVLGSVTDGVVLPYSLNLNGAARAHLVLTFDGTTVADVASAPASGTVTVPAHQAGLALDDAVQVVLTALDPAGAVLARAQTVGSVADGVILPPTLGTVSQSGADLAPGDTLCVTSGETVKFHGPLDSGANHVPISAYDLSVDGQSILDDPSLSGTSSQWVAGTWTPTGTSGSHTLTLSASATGDSSTRTQTYTLVIQPAGTITLDSGPMSVDPAAPLTVAGTLKRASDYAVVPHATVEVWWEVHDTTTWTQLATLTTDAQGHFSTVLNPTDSGKYQLRSPGVPGTVGPTWSVTVGINVATHVLLTVNSTTASVGDTLTFTAVTSSALAGVHAMLQLWNGSYWCTLAHAPFDGTGHASLTYAPGTSGTYKFAALSGYSAGYAPTASDNLTVSVR